MTEDIVATLRRWAKNANEQGVQEAVDGLTAAADEIERLRAERDEARREVCVAREAMIRLMLHGDVAVPQEAMHRAAKARGWDCFKEEQ